MVPSARFTLLLPPNITVPSPLNDALDTRPSTCINFSPRKSALPAI